MNMIAASPILTNQLKRVPLGIADGAIFNVPEQDLDDHPHQYVAKLRQLTPIWCRTLGEGEMDIRVYTVFSHEWGSAILNHPGTRQCYAEFLAVRGVNEGPLQHLYSNGMLAANGSDHRRRRQPLARSFTMPVMKRMQPEIRRIVRDLLVSYVARGGMNIPSDFARILPAKMLCHIMGIPEGDIEMFVGWVQQASSGLSVFATEHLDSINSATESLMEYVKRLLSDRRECPQDDFLTSYLDAVEEIPDYTAAEVYVQIAGTILAAAETTRCAITNAMSLLLEHRAQWDALICDSALVAGAVNESMRFEPAVGTCPRFAAEDFYLGEYLIPANSIVTACLLGALRDPELFSHPGDFDIKRTDFQRTHLAFGGGAHRCLGEGLAWIEVYEAISAFADLLPQVRFESGPARISGFSGVRKTGDCFVCY